MKILAIDPGAVRVGLAACDALEITTRLLPVLMAKPLDRCLHALADLVAAEEFQTILIGLPLNMDGSEGEAARRSRRFSEKLVAALKKKGLGAQVRLWDERLTSFEAESRVRSAGIARGKAKDFLDSVAAEVLLQDFLEHQRQPAPATEEKP